MSGSHCLTLQTADAPDCDDLSLSRGLRHDCKMGPQESNHQEGFQFEGEKGQENQAWLRAAESSYWFLT